jgi:nitrate reductase (cytochrome), electron transfer subunit
MQRYLAGVAAAAVLTAMTLVAIAADNVTTLRVAPLAENQEAPRMLAETNDDRRQVRNYPEQPPVIPHKASHYQVDLNVNKCLGCHSRAAIETSQAPMVSITHYMDRDGQFLATVSPRRYFCNQCHVSQNEAQPLIDNTFVDIDKLLNKAR